MDTIRQLGPELPISPNAPALLEWISGVVEAVGGRHQYSSVKSMDVQEDGRAARLANSGRCKSN